MKALHNILQTKVTKSSRSGTPLHVSLTFNDDSRSPKLRAPRNVSEQDMQKGTYDKEPYRHNETVVMKSNGVDEDWGDNLIAESPEREKECVGIASDVLDATKTSPLNTSQHADIMPNRAKESSSASSRQSGMAGDLENGQRFSESEKWVNDYEPAGQKLRLHWNNMVLWALFGCLVILILLIVLPLVLTRAKPSDKPSAVVRILCRRLHQAAFM